MTCQLRVVEEADGTIVIELETTALDLTFELEESDADDLVKDLQAILQDRWIERIPYDD